MVDGNPDLRVPKRRVRVEVALRGAAPRSCEMFVAEHQEVLALLEGSAHFLPVVDGGHTVLVGRDAVSWVLVEAAEPEELVLYDQRRDVTVRIQGGHELLGTIVYSAPPDQARLVDELNRTGLFLSLFCERGVYLVRKSDVLTVTEQT